MALRSASPISIALVLGCTLPNPAFEDGGLDEAETRDATGEGESVGDGDGDGDPTTSSTTEGDDDPMTTDTTDTTDEVTDDADPCLPLMECDGECIETDFDDENCGGCGEVCDPGSLCAHGSCVTKRYVFVTATPYDANLGGVNGANGICQLTADLVGLDGAFKAWISNNENYPAVGFSHAGAFVRMDEQVVAYSWDELVDGTLENPINLTEEGTPVAPVGDCSFDTAVWTGTSPSGNAAASTCTGWTSSLMGSGLLGNAGASDEAWTQSECSAPCAAKFPLYCFQQ